MRIDIMTLFPETVGDMMNESILGRAQERDYIKIECHQIRDYTTNKQKQFEIVPIEADIIRQIFQLYIDGWGYKRIANHLTDQGIPTRPSWTIAPSPSPGHNEQSGAETTIEA